MNLITGPLGFGLKVFTHVVLIPLRPIIKAVLHEEVGHYLTDIEWRYAQARDLLKDAGGQPGSSYLRKMTAEDLDTLNHQLTGYTLTNNVDNVGAAAPGSIRWQALHIVYQGVDYNITDGASLLKYHTFVFPGLALVSSNTKPVLGKDDMLLFVNNAGIGTVSASSGSASLPTTVGNNSVDNAALVDGAVAGAKIAALGIASGKLATGAIDSSTAFGAGVVNNAAIGALAIGSGQLAAGAVIAGKIAAGGINLSTQFAADIVDAAAIAPLAVSGAELAAGAVVAGKIAVGGISAANQIAGGMVDGTALASNAVTDVKIATGGIGAGKLATGAVSASTMIANDIVNTAQIAPLAVASAELAANAVTAGKIATGAVNSSTIFTAGIVNSAAIGPGAVGPTGLNILSHVLY